MAKTKISEYDSTAANNTDIDGINIAEGCAPSGINNAIREQMAHLKDGLGAGTPVFLDQTNNRVGILTDSPNRALSIEDGDVQIHDTGTSGDPLLNFSVGNTQASPTQSWSLRIDNSDSDKFQLLDVTDSRIVLTADGGGNVGIGTSTPMVKLHVHDSSTARFALTNDTTGQTFPDGFELIADGTDAFLQNRSSGNMFFATNNTERMRIDSSGNLSIGTTSINPSGDGNYGICLDADGHADFSTDESREVLDLNRLADGTMIKFRAQNVNEGSIVVSGTTVSYNGGHLSRWSRLESDNKDTSIVKGTVMTNLNKMVVWSYDAVAATYYEEGDELPVVTEATYYEEGDTIPEGSEIGDVKTEAVYAQVGDEKTPAVDAYTEDNEQLNCMAVSSVEGDPNVAGVFVNWDHDDDDFNDMNVAMTGDMVIRIAQGTTVARGDLLMSAGDGTAKPQGDDIVRSKTIAKVTSTNVSHTYDDGSYLVPCVLMAC